MTSSRLDMIARRRPGYNPALTPMGCRILDTLIRRQAVTGAQLVDILWGDDPDGGPSNAPKCLSVHVHRMRWALRHVGIEVRSIDYENSIGRMCTYALNPAHREAAREFLDKRIEVAMFGPTNQLELFAHA